MDVLSFLAQIHSDQLGLAALVSLMVVSIIRGWIVPRSVVADRMKDKDTQIATLEQDRDNWKDAFFRKSDLSAEQSKQLGSLIESGQATVRLVETLRNVIEREGFILPTPKKEEA